MFHRMASRRHVLAASGLGLIAASSSVLAGQSLVVFAAASLREALDDVAMGFMASHSITVRSSYAASSQLARQIAAGAPADIFISADLEWMEWLEKEKLIDSASRQILLGNALVLIAPAGGGDRPVTLERGVDLAGLLGDRRLVIAEPASVPVGRYARQSLEYLGQWAAVENRLVFAANGRAALALVARGEAGLGIVYATDAAAEPGVSVIARFNEDSHKPILYPIAKTPQAQAGAEAFLRFLSAPSTRLLFERRGFRYLLSPSL